MHLVPTQAEVVELLRQTGGLRKGHFEYPDGMHTNEYLQVALKRALLPYFAFVSIRVSGRETDPFRDAYSHKPLVEVIKNNDVAGAARAFEQSFGPLREYAMGFRYDG